MKRSPCILLSLGLLLFAVLAAGAVPGNARAANEKILFLHHSTGAGVWGGGVAAWFANYNSVNGASLAISERSYPTTPYPWANYPYDYWNLWLNGACDSSDSDIECMNTLAASNDVIIYKHCYPGAGVLADTGSPDISSSRKSLENYKLQYRALRAMMDGYPDTLFILWTLAPLHRLASNDGDRARAKQFVDWVKGDFLTEGGAHPNIMIFDFFGYAAEQSATPANGVQYALRYDYEQSHTDSDSHPNTAANQAIAPIFSQLIVDSIDAFNAGGGGTGPSVGATCPADGTSGAPTNAVVAAVFSADMNASSITASTFTLNGGSAVAGTVSYDAGSRRAVFAANNPLASDTTYTATIASSVSNDQGVAMGSDFTWSFATGSAQDSDVPTVGSTSPGSGETGVLRNPVVNVVFDGLLDPTMSNGILSLKHTQSGVSVSGQFIHDASLGRARFAPSSMLEANANYTATVSGSACDLAGNQMGVDYVWTFETGESVNVPAFGGLGLASLTGLLAMAGGFGLQRRKRRNGS